MKKQAFALHLMQSFFCLILVAGCSSSRTATVLPSTDTPTPISTPIPAPTKSPSEIQESIRPLLMMHYMPWYQTPSVSGNWGWHWTMDHFDPNQKAENGHLAIASHYYPLTGPYDSRDDAVLEYQVMLMKMSGIDGIIVDWYGFDNFWDYGTINASTQKLFQYDKKAGLLFVICYEDRTSAVVPLSIGDNSPPLTSALP